ncbi:hypothetical protein QMZ92_31375 [Streptomyces sp. HNM0645]|uniref:hypothetical protein n=1 Tax=Streptomyces sp. HNM0645 TaxID=2782343 RepID=UPI0024B655A3|nr:hypothetical protein [Streptomyces sp. HNM0645]MDI9888733.1 hypothetical protein [Streptomyces sp. HNM0645]
MGVAAIAAYATYLAVVLGRADGAAPAAAPYASAPLRSVGTAIAVAIALHVAIAPASPGEAGPKGERDREIAGFGELTGQSFVVLGGVAALVLAMAEADHFWIANTVCPAFVLSAVLGSVARTGYRWGFQPW